MIEFIQTARGPAQRQRTVGLWAALAAVVVALLTASATAQAARECEYAYYVPSEGACARLATAELFYYDTGAPRSNSETVILLHAASGNADAFKHNLAALAAAGYRAIAYDRKNVGRSSNTLRDDALARSRGTTVEDLDSIANYLGIEKFHLVGIAAGAQVAIQYAASDTRGRVRSLVLAATLGPPGLSANEPALSAVESNITLPFEIFCTATIVNPPPSPLRLIATTATATVTIPEVLAEHRELGTWFRATNPAGVQEYRAIAANARHATFDGCRSTSIGANQSGLATSDPRNPNTFAKISSLVTARTLLLAGTGDVFFSPPVHMRLWGSYIPTVQYVQLDTGHAPELEDPEGFNSAVVRFLGASAGPVSLRILPAVLDMRTAAGIVTAVLTVQGATASTVSNVRLAGATPANIGPSADGLTFVATFNKRDLTNLPAGEAVVVTVTGDLRQNNGAPSAFGVTAVVRVLK